MKLKYLITSNFEDQLKAQGQTIESVFDLDLTKCKPSFLHDIGELFYLCFQACEDTYSDIVYKVKEK